SADAEVREVEEVLGGRERVEKLEGVLELCAAGQRLLRQAQSRLGDLPELRNAIGERGHGLTGKLERPARGTEAVVDARQHPAQAPRPRRRPPTDARPAGAPR